MPPLSQIHGVNRLNSPSKLNYMVASNNNKTPQHCSVVKASLELLHSNKSLLDNNRRSLVVVLAPNRMHLASRVSLLVDLVLHQPSLSGPQLFLASRTWLKVDRAFSVKTNKLNRTLFTANSPHSSSSHLNPLISLDQGHSRSSSLHCNLVNNSNSPNKTRYSAELVNSSSNRTVYSEPSPRRLR